MLAGFTPLADLQSINHPAENLPLSEALRFSLILATVGRTAELDRFLKHLAAQSYRNFELIVVDQNPDDRLLPLLAPYQERFPVVHLRSAIGLSRARNAGLPHASGDILAFPDDDCWYSADLLQRVATLFQKTSTVDCITGRPVDACALGFDRSSGRVNKRNVFRRGISYTIFIRNEVASCIGRFDESLGLGATSGKIAAEETDYLLRALSASFHISYFAELCVPHGDSKLVYDEALIRRQYGSALALGCVLKKHQYPFWFVLYYWVRPFGRACLSFVMFQRPRARYHYAAFRGRVTGWLNAPSP